MSLSKKTPFISWLVLSALILPAFQTADAASLNFGPITATAVVASALALNVTILDATTGKEIPFMDFGELDNKDGQFQSSRFFRVLLAPPLKACARTCRIHLQIHRKRCP